MRDEHLTQNFTRQECACQGTHCCGHSAPMDNRLMSLLQAIRSFVERPVTMSSGFRCRTHNAETPNAHPDSYHTLGQAADIFVKGMKIKDLYDACLQVCEMEGYGHLIYYEDRGIVHVDIRNY